MEPWPATWTKQLSSAVGMAIGNQSSHAQSSLSTSTASFFLQINLLQSDFRSWTDEQVTRDSKWICGCVFSHRLFPAMSITFKLDLDTSLWYRLVLHLFPTDHLVRVELSFFISVAFASREGTIIDLLYSDATHCILLSNSFYLHSFLVSSSCSLPSESMKTIGWTLSLESCEKSRLQTISMNQ